MLGMLGHQGQRNIFQLHIHIKVGGVCGWACADLLATLDKYYAISHFQYHPIFSGPKSGHCLTLSLTMNELTDLAELKKL